LAQGFVRRTPGALLDCAAVTGAYLLAVAVRAGARPEEFASDLRAILGLALIAGVLQVAGNILFLVYWRDWSVASIEDLLALAKATALSLLVVLAFDSVLPTHVIPYGAVFSAVFVVFFLEAALQLRPQWRDIFRVAFGRGHAGER